MAGLQILAPEASHPSRLRPQRILVFVAVLLVLSGLTAGSLFILPFLGRGGLLKVSSKAGTVVLIPKGRTHGNPVEPGRVVRPEERLQIAKGG